MPCRPFYDGNTLCPITRVLNPCLVPVIHGPTVKARKSSSMDVPLPNSGDSNGVRYIRFGLAGPLKCQSELLSPSHGPSC